MPVVIYHCEMGLWTVYVHVYLCGNAVARESAMRKLAGTGEERGLERSLDERKWLWWQWCGSTTLQVGREFFTSTESSTVWSVQWHQPSSLNLLSIPHTGLIREAKSPAANLIILCRCVSAAGVGKLCLIESKWVCSTISGRVIQRHRKLVFNQAARLSSFSVTVAVCFAVSLLLE